MKSGDRVQWARKKEFKETIRFTFMEGIIKSIEGEYAIVKPYRKNTERIKLSKLKSIDEPDFLTMWFNNMEK